jgi:hypothetical protein
MRKAMPASFAIERDTRKILDKLARTERRRSRSCTASSYKGNGAKLLRDLADAMGA